MKLTVTVALAQDRLQEVWPVLSELDFVQSPSVKSGGDIHAVTFEADNAEAARAVRHILQWGAVS